MLSTEFRERIRATAREQLGAAGYVLSQRGDGTEMFRHHSGTHEAEIKIVDVYYTTRAQLEARVIIYKSEPQRIQEMDRFIVQPRHEAADIRDALLRAGITQPTTLADRAAMTLLRQENGPIIMRRFLPRSLCAHYLGQ